MNPDEIPLSSPDITHAEIDAVTQVLRSGRLALGPMAERFEHACASVAGTEHGVAVNSGTSGLTIALEALGVGPGDEVITTPFSFIASANCIVHRGATPVFVDIEPSSLNMDPAKIEAAITPKTKAILAVETFGNPAHMDAYARIASKHEIPLVEDCCEALGASLKGRPCGSFGRDGVFGFYPNKQITTGEGGMIVTDDSRLADTCRSLRNQGRSVPRATDDTSSKVTGSWLTHDAFGYNFRMSEVSAALGLAQIRRLNEIIEKRQRVANAYINRLFDSGRVVLPTVLGDASLSWFVFVVRLETGYTREERDEIIAGMRRHDIGAGDYFPCIHLQPPYRARFGHAEGDFPIAESVAARTIALPFHNHLSDREVDLVCQTLDLMITRQNLSRP